MEIIKFGAEHLDKENMHIYEKIVSDNLLHFNSRMGTDIALKYKPNKFAYFVRVDETIYNDYFDDYCVTTINWLVGLHNYPQIIENWIDKEKFKNFIIDTYHSKKDIRPNEAETVMKLFNGYIPMAPYFNEVHRQKLTKQISEAIDIVKSY